MKGQFKALKRIREVADYVLDTEAEDFWENPSREHIYFSAVALQEGEEAAERMYQQVLKEQEG